MGWRNAIRMAMVAVVLLVGTMALPGAASAQVAIGISVGFAPPEIPVYEQPICPAEGYIWTPGYWAWDDDAQDYYWVPGTWVLAPEAGFFWTPGYWGWGGSAFFFHEGYWGPHIGFYGGINYGFGYFGHGYEGGRWEGGHFFYNTTVNRVNVTEIRNVYNTRIDVRNESHVSFNGGNGGINERASSQEEAAARDRHIGAVGAQQEHVQAARGNPQLRASSNHGRPPIAATARPGAFSGGGVVAARSGGNYNPPANRGPKNDERTNAERNNPGANNPNRPPNASSGANNNNRATTFSHSREVPQHSAPQADANTNQKYQQQQEKLAQKQNQEHQKLQQQQEQEHQRATQQNANAAKQQQLEQKHQQQTQQMEQKHTQQQQKLQQKAPPPPRQSESKPHGKP